MKNLDPKVVEKLYRYCAYQDRCTFEVKEKLKRMQVPESQANVYIAHLIGEQFLDDERFVASFIRGKLKFKRWGRNKIRAKLFEKRLPKYLIDKYLENIDDNNYSNTLRSLLEEKKAKVNKEGYQLRDHLYRFALNKGFESDVVAKALSEIMGDVTY